jgi:peptidoglycan/xylan/chitin deacetylase (PgdA/CDA1 family)
MPMWQESKTRLKRIVTAALYYSGSAWLCCGLRFRRRAVVLMYHRVLPGQPPHDAFSADAIVVTPTTFERQMRFLRRFFNPVGIEQFRSMIQGETPWRPRTCLVTFDDGWFDNAEHALPVLERHSVPAVVFVATAYLGTRTTFWQERLARLLFNAWLLGERSRRVFAEFEATEILQLGQDQARVQIRELITRIKSRTQNEINGLIERLTQCLHEHGVILDSCGDDRFMSWAQAAAMLDSGLVAIGSHAHTHAPLTSISHDDVRRELRQSTDELQARLRYRPKFFAYPNGDYDEHVVGLVREASYQLAFTTDPGWVARGDHPLRLKRINIGERGTESPAGFLCRLLRWL